MGRHVVSVIVASDGRLDVRVAVVASARFGDAFWLWRPRLDASGAVTAGRSVRLRRHAAGAATTTAAAAGPRQERARVQPTAGAASRGVGANCGAAQQVVRRRVIAIRRRHIVL